MACAVERGRGMDYAAQDALCLGELTGGPQGKPEIELNFHCAGRKPRGLLETLHGLARFPVAQEGVAEIHMVPRGLRCNCHGKAELLDRVGGAFAAQQRNAEEVQRIGIARREAQGQPEMPLGVGISAGLETLRARFQLRERFARGVCQNFSARWIAGRAAISSAQRATLGQPSHSSATMPLARAYPA